MFVGSLLSGVALDFFSTTVNGKLEHNWQGFWLGSGAGALLILALVAIFFQTRAKIENKKTA
jgi:ABC-type multidrug transport system permease subunit